MKPYLSIHQLHKAYGSKIILDSVSLDVYPGQCFGLLGKNGAGKSTLIDCIMHLKAFDQGKITLLDQQPKDFTNDFFNDVAVQFQNSSYPEKLKVYELCQLYQSFYQHPKDYHILLETLELSTLLKQEISQLSGGEKQRLAIALVLIGQPKIVFLDELTTGLDPSARRQVWKHLQSLKAQGMSLFLTSHSMDEVAVLCEIIAILHQGKIVVKGTVEEVIYLSGKETLEDAYLTFIQEDEDENI